MIPKIIDMLSGAVILASTIAAVPMALCNPDGPAFVAWVLAVMLSGLWQLFRYQTDDGPLLKMPRSSSNEYREPVSSDSYRKRERRYGCWL